MKPFHAVTAALCLLAGSARADDAPPAAAAGTGFAQQGAKEVSVGLELDTSGGTGEANGTEVDLDDHISVDVTAGFDYFVIDGLALGAFVGYGSSVDKSGTSNDKSEQGLLTAGLEARYYGRVSPHGVFLYGGLDGQFIVNGTLRDRTNGVTAKSAVSGYNYGLTAGVAVASSGPRGASLAFGVEFGGGSVHVDADGPDVDLHVSGWSTATELGFFF